MKPESSYLIRRLLTGVPVLFLLLAAVFGLVQLLPGGPEDHLAQSLPSNAGPMGSTALAGLSSDEIDQLRTQLGQNLSPAEQFAHLTLGYLSGDLGQSLFYQRPVADLLIERIPLSALLGLSALALAVCTAVPLGLLQAMRRGGPLDRGLSVLTLVLYATPGFVLGALLVQWFSLQSGVGWGPVLCLAIGFFASLVLITRAAALEELNRAYVWTAEATGATRLAILREQVLPNVLLPALAAMPSWFVSAAVSGALLIETLFGVEGMGLLAVEAVTRRDYPVVMACVFVAGVVSLLAKLLIDMAYGLVDPRVRIHVRPQA